MTLSCHSPEQRVFFKAYISWYEGFQGGASGRESTYQYRGCKRWRFNPWVGKIPRRRKWQPAPVFLPGKFHRERNLVGYVHGVTKSWSWLRNRTHTHTQAVVKQTKFYRFIPSFFPGFNNQKGTLVYSNLENSVAERKQLFSLTSKSISNYLQIIFPNLPAIFFWSYFRGLRVWRLWQRAHLGSFWPVCIPDLPNTY